jgi:hypothetical protein
MAFVANQVLTAAELNDFEPNSLNVDGGTLYVDKTNNRVGVLDSSPSFPLDVNGTSRFVGAAQFDAGVTVAGTAVVTGDLSTANSELFVDVSANRVGINDSTPSHSLDVNGSFRVTGTPTFDSTIVAGSINASGNVVAAGGFYYANGGNDRIYFDDATNRWLFTADDTTVAGVDNSRVGAGKVVAYETSSTAPQFTHDDAATSGMGVDSAGQVRLFVNGGSRLLINSAGEVLVSYASLPIATGGAKNLSVETNGTLARAA